MMGGEHFSHLAISKCVRIVSSPIFSSVIYARMILSPSSSEPDLHPRTGSAILLTMSTESTYSVRNIRYFEKPDGVDIYADIFRGEEKVGWLEQAAYAAPFVYFDSIEISEKFEAETGQIINSVGWEEFIEFLVQECEKKFYGPEEYDKMLQEVLNG